MPLNPVRFKQKWSKLHVHVQALLLGTRGLFHESWLGTAQHNQCPLRYVLCGLLLLIWVIRGWGWGEGIKEGAVIMWEALAYGIDSIMDAKCSAGRRLP